MKLRTQKLQDFLLLVFPKKEKHIIQKDFG